MCDKECCESDDWERDCGFPDTSTCRVIVREMNILSQMMVSDRLQGSSHNTLKYDGTTKSKEHWVGSS